MAVPQLEEMLEAREVPTKKPKTNKKDQKKVLLVAQELKIARALAGNDKTMRYRALKSLKKWFNHRSQNLPFTEDDFLRLWKGLFYSMWMSDKPLIQEECAENIASLLHELPVEHSLLLFKCGLITLTNEWFGIDQLRLDKFLMFVRRFLRQALFVLKNNGFKKNLITSFGEILSLTVLNPSKVDAMGLFMHVTEIFLEELAKVSDGQLKPELTTDFLIPFVKCLAVADDDRRIRQIRKFIFLDLMKQSDLGLEYQEKYNAWKKEGFPAKIHAMQKIEVNEEDDGSSDENDTSLSAKPLDPRAGRVDVELAQIKFNSKAVADLLLKNKYLDGSTVASRNAVTTLANQFQKLGRGVYPLGITELKISKSEVKDMSLKKAVNRLVKFEKKLMGEDPRSKKRKLNEGKGEKAKKVKLGNGVDHETDDFKDELAKFIEESEGETVQTKPKKTKSKNKEKQIKKRKLGNDETNIFNVDTPIKKKVRKSEEFESEPETVFERNSGTWLVYHQDESDVSGFLETSSADLGNFLESHVENLCERKNLRSDSSEKKNSPSKAVMDITENENSQTTSDSSQKRNSPSKSMSDSPGKKKSPIKTSSDPDSSKNGSILRGKARKRKNSNSFQENSSDVMAKMSSPTKELFPKNPWDEPLEEGEYEICIPSKSYVAKLKKISQKSSQNVQELINNSLGKSRHSIDFKRNINTSTPQSVKKVKINTKLNKSQEFHEYHSQILSSPSITFDASKKPGKPLLKTPNINSPINPFYKQLYDV